MKMKIYLLSLSVLAATFTFAQDKDAKKKEGTSMSIGVDAALPVGKDLKDAWNFGVGASAKVAFNIFEGGDVTVSAGYLKFIGKKEAGATENNPALNTMPVKAGLRFRIAEGFYGEPQLGYTIAKISGIEGNLNGFTYAAALGYVINNKIDIAARYEAWTKSENGVTATPSFAGLRIAYKFPL